MKIKLFLFVYVLLLPILLAAGGSQEPSLSGKETPKETSVTIVDSLNRTIVLPSLPERVVQAGSSSFIVNDALFLFPEAAKRVVAMADSNQGRGHFLSVADPLYDEKTILPTTINMEEVLAAKPDLVIMKDFLFSKYDKEFQKVGIPVIYLNLESPEAWFEDLDVLGTLFGNPARADHLKELFSTYISQVTQPLSALEEGERKKDLILYYSEKDGSGAFQVPPLTFIQTEMLKISGADPIWKDADLGKRWTKVGFEQIAAWDPDQIFLISYRKPMEEVLNILAESPY
jgi:iron complex transport system substrate-binding protein